MQARRLCAAAAGSFLLGAGLAGAEPADGERLFPPQSAVVLLTGVPGDVESEESYREQLQGWLELATGSGQAARVFVLCDEPQGTTNPKSEIRNQKSPVTSHQLPSSRGTGAAFWGWGRGWQGGLMRWW